MTDVMIPEVTDVDPLYEEPVEMEPAQVGGIAYAIDEQTLNKLGADVCRDFEADETSRDEWKKRAEKALNRAAQEGSERKDWPWKGASNVGFPILTQAALQFQARAYPALVKNDEAISVKVFGTLPERPEGAEEAAQQGNPQAAQVMQQYTEALERRKGKEARAKRVASYLNYQLFYEIPDWEADTDAMLLALPIVGCAFRKVFVDPDTGKVTSRYVPAMNLVVPQSARDLATTPRATEIMHGVYPYQIKERIFAGEYIDWGLDLTDDDDQCPRKLIEQYRRVDLDNDGLEEPYIITVDTESGKVLRIEPGWLKRYPESTKEAAVRFERYMPYTLYPFIPDPKGRFYPIGFGHLLDPITDIVNTTINQMIDAGTAQIAGGGWIASGLRLQGAGMTNKLQFEPGEYKVVNINADQLRNGIVERTFPNPSPVAFQMLELMLGAAQDITGTSDVLTGQAPATAPVGTTMALIEQGLQGFTAVYKRVFRSGKQEYRTFYDMIGSYGSAEDYNEVLDDPQADFATDFSPEGKDIVPVSDPTVSTKMQQMAKGQFLLNERGKQIGLDDRELTLRGYRAMDIDDPEGLLAAPQQPPPEVQAMAQAEVAKTQSEASKNNAAAAKAGAEAQQTELQTGVAVAEIDALTGGLPGVVQPSGDQVDLGGNAGVSRFAENGMG